MSLSSTLLRRMLSLDLFVKYSFRKKVYVRVSLTCSITLKNNFPFQWLDFKSVATKQCAVGEGEYKKVKVSLKQSEKPFLIIVSLLDICVNVYNT